MQLQNHMEAMINKYRLILFLLVLINCREVQGQISFDSNFENGRLDTSYFEDSAFILAPITNLHFRITNALNQNPLFQIYDSIGYQLRPYHHMVYRYEGQPNWHFFDTAYKNINVGFYHFHNFTSFIQDTVYIAYWYPYTLSDLEQYLTSISGNPYLLNNSIKGTTIGGNNLYGYQITDTTYSECYKTNVVITARQHPTESINGYFIEGLSNYLLYSQDLKAVFLRRNFHFFIYPMLNPDGVYFGSGQNLLGQGLNREWEDSLILGGTPEIDTIRSVIWHETNQKVDWSIDIHANAGSNIPYYWWGYTSTSGVPQWQIDDASKYVQSVSTYDSSSTINTSSYQNTIQGSGVSNSKTAANWFRKSFNSISFTFEPTSEPMGPIGNNKYSIAQLKDAGKSLAMGFYDVYDTIQALGGNIMHTNNLLVANISGGYAPYTYAWTGPINGNSDTLMSPLAGFYTVVVTDSLGCEWKQSIYNGTLLVPPRNVFNCNVYPNPAIDCIYINCSDSLSSPSVVELYDNLGRLISSQIVLLGETSMIELPPDLRGIYTLTIVTDNGYHSKRVLIMNLK